MAKCGSGTRITAESSSPRTQRLSAVRWRRGTPPLSNGTRSKTLYVVRSSWIDEDGVRFSIKGGASRSPQWRPPTSSRTLARSRAAPERDRRKPSGPRRFSWCRARRAIKPPCATSAHYSNASSRRRGWSMDGASRRRPEEARANRFEYEYRSTII